MYQAIHEPIDVMAFFKGQKTEPTMFRWMNRCFQVKRVHAVEIRGRGRDKAYFFSVSDGRHLYRLSFSVRSLKWRLEEMAGDEMLFA